MKTLIGVAVPAITFALLTTVGSDLRVADFRRLRRQPGVVTAGLLLPVLALPALAAGLIALFKPAPEVASGLLLVAACPIGGISNLYSALARASAALSVALTGLSCLLAAFTIPAFGAIFERVLEIPLGLTIPLPLLLAQLLLMLVAPVSLGMWARHRRPDAVDRHRPAIQRASVVSLTILLGLIVIGDFDRFRVETSGTVPLAATFVTASFGAGWIGGMLVRAEPRDRFTLAAEFATRNVAVAATLAITVLHRIEFAAFATIYILTEAPLLLLAVAVFRARRLPAPVAVRGQA